MPQYPNQCKYIVLVSHKKNSKPLSELERLQKEIQELKTENALLKKVRALVEERNARLRKIGQVPSKN